MTRIGLRVTTRIGLRISPLAMLWRGDVTVKRIIVDSAISDIADSADIIADSAPALSDGGEEVRGRGERGVQQA